MKASELRLGNYLNYNILDSVKQGQVTNITKNRLFIDGISSKYLCAEPIPLTEEWLIKLGAIKIKEGVFEIGYLKFRIHSHQYGIDFHFGTSGNHYIKSHFVHSFQNLYFALTQKELTI